MNLENVFLLVKGGIPNTTTSKIEYYDVSFSINKQSGFIEKRNKNEWKLYLGWLDFPTEKKYLLNQDSKYYYFGKTFEDCRIKVEEIFNLISIVIERTEVERLISIKSLKSKNI